jgi:pantoate--beta-alanine ligase
VVETVATIEGLRDRIGPWRRAGARIGLVPTMGYLHEGHLRLIDAARSGADRVVATIFVNPLQFRPGEDLARYPRDLARDQGLLAARGAHLIFAPSMAEMYPIEPTIRVDPGPLGERWEGAVRPGHFAGVLTVVAKLFHQVGPELAWFGQKDIQQATLIRRMVAELDWPVEIRVVPTAREPDGLALSSRNVFLSPEDRTEALALSGALRAAVGAWRSGERSADGIERAARAVFDRHPRIAPDYVAVVDPARFEPVDPVDDSTIVAVAARVGQTRLIDNVRLGAGLE